MSGTQVDPNVVFNEIPSPLYVPGEYMEVRPTFGNVGVLPIPARNVIIGQMLSTGTATAGTVYTNIISPSQVTTLAGAGSMAERMAYLYFDGPGINIPLDMVFLADAAGASKAAWTITFGGSWTLNGTTAIAVAGVRLATGTLSSDTPTTTATEFAALINADPQLPVSATASAGVVTATAKHGGLEPNNISFVVSPAAGDTLVTGMTCVVASTVTGATNPSIAAAITAIAGTWYTGICAPWQDTTNIGLLTAELARRFNAMVKEDARAAICITGTYSQALSSVAAINSQFGYALPMTQPGSEPWAVAASLLGVVENSLLIDPSLQLRDLVLPGIVGPLPSNRLTEPEQELMLAGKGSTYNVLSSGAVTLQRVVSTYTTDGAGVADSTTWFDIMTTAVASRIRYDWRQFSQLMHPRAKLAPDGSLAELSDPTVVTPRRRKGEWAMRMNVYASAGWIENETVDAAASIFTIDATDRNRLDEQTQYTIIGNLMVEAGVMMFAA